MTVALPLQRTRAQKNGARLVSRPEGSAAELPAFNVLGPQMRSFVPDVVGEYVMELVVMDDECVVSDPCQVTLIGRPTQNLWIEMFWEQPGDDMDLHLVRGGGAYTTSDDCFYGNCVGGGPDWGAQDEWYDDPFLDLDDIPLDDPATYKLFQQAQTSAVFQFESRGMRDLLKQAKPERLDDLIALNALYRPGPLRSGMVDDFIARKQGKTEVKYELPELEPILADTYGVIAYQEQVMRISNVLAGFTLGEADLLRKAMGKKNPEVMAKMRGKFLEGAKKNGQRRRRPTSSS